jgi:hypothetical protein
MRVMSKRASIRCTPPLEQFPATNFIGIIRALVLAPLTDFDCLYGGDLRHGYEPMAAQFLWLSH